MELVFKEGKKVLVTLLIIDSISLILSLLIGAKIIPVIGGIIYGTLITLINFALLGIVVQNALIRSPRSAKRYLQTNYIVRFILLGLLLTIPFVTWFINEWCVLACIMAPKITYTVIGFKGALKDKYKNIFEDKK